MGGRVEARELETERLVLRPLRLEDGARTQLLFPHWEIVKYLNPVVPWPYPPDGAVAYYRDVALPAIERGDEWQWTLRLREAPEEFIGAISLHRGEWDNRGYWLGLPWQGRGFMTEAVVAVTAFWFEELGFERLRAPKAVANLASRRISEKTGMRVIRAGEREFCSGTAAAEVWEISAEAWREWIRRRDGVRDATITFPAAR